MNRAVFAIVFICASQTTSVVSKGVILCSESEYAELHEKHLQCTQQVEERYALLAQRFDAPDLPPPGAIAGINERNPEVMQICNMLHDVIEKCGRVYEKCLAEKDYRHFLDDQLEVFIQLMTRMYNLGSEVHQCDAVQEYERSGRREQVQSTEKCNNEQVKRLTIRYQQCIEDANIDMTSKMLGHQANHQMAFETLCVGIDQVVHGCGEILVECYAQDEIEETKLGQLEMTKKVFTDIMDDPKAKQAANHEHQWNFDVEKCGAFQASPGNRISPFYFLFILISFTWLFV